ncbi:hypothetical protein SDC9_93361 [bioreactor metagenome]|uniref:Uncharacterized protein n=1 Tax=bioreactor metagenome TaxID=1076179 RepID=A0A645A165_9ZZZZ
MVAHGIAAEVGGGERDPARQGVIPAVCHGFQAPAAADVVDDNSIDILTRSRGIGDGDAHASSKLGNGGCTAGDAELIDRPAANRLTRALRQRRAVGPCYGKRHAARARGTDGGQRGLVKADGGHRA